LHDAETVLGADGLGLDIGGATIVADVSLDVRRGELLGIIGPNGAGKTSLFNLFSGLRPATRGRVMLAGEDVTALPPEARAARGLGRTFQVSNVFPTLSVLENVRLAAEASLGGSARIWRRAARVKPALDRARSSLGDVGLSRRESAIAGALAHGEKRKLEVAMVLAGDPKVVLLDEPMAGASTSDVPQLVELIRLINSELGKTVLLVEHHVHVVTELADRIAVMHHGALLACGEPEAIMQNELVQTAYLGRAL
jgi:branched-chain amino acid transport system ATP-binding protein